MSGLSSFSWSVTYGRGGSGNVGVAASAAARKVRATTVTRSQEPEEAKGVTNADLLTGEFGYTFRVSSFTCMHVRGIRRYTPRCALP